MLKPLFKPVMAIILIAAILFISSSEVLAQVNFDYNTADNEMKKGVDFSRRIIAYICYVFLLLGGVTLLYLFAEKSPHLKTGIVTFFGMLIVWLFLKNVLNLPTF